MTPALFKESNILSAMPTSLTTLSVIIIARLYPCSLHQAPIFEHDPAPINVSGIGTFNNSPIAKKMLIFTRVSKPMIESSG